MGDVFALLPSPLWAGGFHPTRLGHESLFEHPGGWVADVLSRLTTVTGAWKSRIRDRVRCRKLLEDETERVAIRGARRRRADEPPADAEDGGYDVAGNLV